MGTQRADDSPLPSLVAFSADAQGDVMLWGLAAGGRAGVARVLAVLDEELGTVMQSFA